MNDPKGVIRYIGVVTEEDCNNFLERWIRPDKYTGEYFWTHGTNKKGKSTVERIADAVRDGLGPICLHFSNYRRLFDAVASRAKAQHFDFGPYKELPEGTFLEMLEHAWIYLLQPEWNRTKRKRPADNLWTVCDYWT
jgi:hypothetical protein